MEFVQLWDAIKDVAMGVGIMLALAFAGTIVDMVKKKYLTDQTYSNLDVLRDAADAAVIAAEKKYGVFKPVLDMVAPEQARIIEEQRALFNADKKRYAIDLVLKVIPDEHDEVVGAFIERALDNYQRYSKRQG